MLYVYTDNYIFYTMWVSVKSMMSVDLILLKSGCISCATRLGTGSNGLWSLSPIRVPEACLIIPANMSAQQYGSIRLRKRPFKDKVPAVDTW